MSDTDCTDVARSTASTERSPAPLGKDDFTHASEPRPGLTVVARNAAIVTMSGALGLYSFAKRAACSKLRLGVGRMRTFRSTFYSEMWRSSALAVGAQFTQLLDGSGEIRRGERRLIVFENRTSIDDPQVVARAADKPAVYDLLSRAGIAVPRYVLVNIGEISRALAFLKEHPSGVVIKPGANTGGGAGISAFITTPRQLLVAAAWAWAYADRILVEERILGDCYRVLVMDGEIVHTVMRRPPAVTGDGRSSIRGLIQRENKLRRLMGTVRGQALLRIDPDLRSTISGQGLTLRSRPSRGQQVVLKHVVNDNGTAENVPAEGLFDSALCTAARRAAQIVGTRLAGVDLICRNPNCPLETSGGAVIEVNADPGLYYHYDPAKRGFPVAEKVLRLYFRADQTIDRAVPLCRSIRSGETWPQ